MNTHIARGIVALLFFVLLVNTFLFHSFGSFGVSLTLIGLLVFAVRTKTHAFTSNMSKGTLLVAAVSAIVPTIQENGFVGFIASFFSLGLSLIVGYLGKAGDAPFGRMLEIVVLPFRLVGAYFVGIRSMVGQALAINGAERSRVWLRALGVGLVVGLPFCVFLLHLFSGADPIFQHTMRQWVRQDFFERATTRLVVSTLVMALLAPFIFLMIGRLSKRAGSWMHQVSFSREMTVITGLIVAVVGAFLIVQWPYIFVRVAAETDLSRFGVATYSEYVKKGFGEFLFISVVLYMIGWAGLIASRGKGRTSFLIPLQAILLAEIAVFITSIYRRIYLYQLLHGLSLGRVYGGVFLVFVSLLFLLLALRYVWPRVRWIYWEVGGATCLFILFSFTNVERILAMYDPPTVNHRIDTVYLSRLSSDGYEGWLMALNDAQKVLIEASLESQPILNKEDRQRVAYAGMIVERLSRNYHELMTRYGSVYEQQAYIRAVLVHITNTVDQAIPDMTRRAEEERKANLLDGEYSRLLKKYSSDLVFITNQHPTIEQLTVGYPTFGDFGSWQKPYSFYDIYQEARTLTSWDRMLLWNKSGNQAFHRITKDMPVEKLIVLQTAYIALANKIAKQPTGEQGFDSDISLDGPFLGY